MADQTFQVMISDQEYQILKSHQKTNQKFKLEIDDLKINLKNAQNQSQLLSLELAKKDTEIHFLLSVIQNFATGNSQSGQQQISPLKSNTFQILGQSVLEPKKANDRKIKQYNQQLSKKYATLLKQIVSIEERIESQQELITQLNQMNTQKNEALLAKETTFKKQDSGNKTELQKQVSELTSQIKGLKAQCEQQKRQKIQQKLMLEKQKSIIEKEKEQALQQLKKKSEVMNESNKRISVRLQDSNQRIKDLQMENAVLRQGLGTSTFAKDETKNKIKALIDEYVREIEKNLKSIQGLNFKERRELVEHEMKEITDYIPKSISNKK